MFLPGAASLRVRPCALLIEVQTFGAQLTSRGLRRVALARFPKRDDRAAGDHKGAAEDNRQRG